MISRMLALRLFESFSILRWNDRIRPINLTEIDKQGYKAMLTFILAKMEEEKGTKIDWEYLVYGSLFSLMKNIALSDIKATVMSKIKNEHPDEYKRLNEWVVDQYKPLIDDEEFYARFKVFLNEERKADDINFRILRASHKYSTFSEFKIIKNLNSDTIQIRDLEHDLRNDLDKYKDIAGFNELLQEKDLYRAACLIEQLRYQIRWSQTPRIPETSVLGHSMLVACFMIFLSRDLSACTNRLVNNFYAGLFHDLPESVCRDIISPVKRATSSLPEIVRQIEDEVCAVELFPNFSKEVGERLRFLCSMDTGEGDEFSDRIVDNGMKIVFSKDDDCEINKYNEDKFDPIDGRLIKLADEMAAFLEADQSIYHGITSRHLQEGMARIRFKYLDGGTINGIDVKEFFLSFI
jgi:putative hydrolase of HD superfamily